MKKLVRFLTHPISSDNADGTFALWACSGSAVAVLVLAAVFFSRHARDLTELLCGLGLALVAFVALLMTAFSTYRLERTISQHRLPLRARIAEFAGYVATPVVLLIGVWYLATLPLERPGMTMGLLLVLTASMSVVCLSMWSTLWQVNRR